MRKLFGQPSTVLPATRFRSTVGSVRFVVVVLIAATVSCAHVKPSERERLASPAMQFEMDPVVEGQSNSILEITEGSTFPSAGPGTAGAGCGCN